METQKPVPTCVCGSTAFEEVQTRLPFISEYGVTKVEASNSIWARICSQCSQITLWNKKST
jgi:hypothetical protein